MYYIFVCYIDFNELICVDFDVVFVVGGVGKSFIIFFFIIDVRFFFSVCADVYFFYVGGGKGSFIFFKGVFKGAFILNLYCMNRYIYFFDIFFIVV